MSQFPMLRGGLHIWVDLIFDLEVKETPTNFFDK